MLMIKDPKTEYMTNPICVPLERVRFSWMLESAERNQRQTAYQILVRNDDEIVWDSGKIFSEDTTGITYSGKPLYPRTKYSWQVKVWSEVGEKSDFCTPQTFETCLSTAEWNKIMWIGAKNEGLPLFRKSFMVAKKEIARARVYVSGLGVYELTLNGKRVDDGILNPMVTRYHKRYFYNAYDITTMLNEEENVFGVMLGNGYYGMHDNGADWQKENWANACWVDKPKCKLIAFITYADGTENLISTDESWKNAESPICVEEAYYGEEYDARMEQEGWRESDFDDSEWKNSDCVPAPQGQAEIQLAEPCKIIERFSPHLLYHEGNEYLFDTRKMMTGWVRITVCGNRGDEVEISYSERLNEQGKLNQKGLLAEWNFVGRIRQPQTDYFILRGDGKEIFAPHFTYKGFRYVRIRVKSTVTLENVVAELVHVDIAKTGKFDCSNDFLNRLHEACKNTLLNNLRSYPSDTPVYENLGYLADGYLTQEMAHFNFDTIKYYEKWARDIFDQTKENGYIEQCAPIWDEDKENATEWSVAVAVVPYQIYRATGDKTLLFESYEKAKKVFSYQMSLCNDGIANSMWGDLNCPSGHTIPEFSATVYLFYMANILAETAKMQGNERESKYYKGQADTIKRAFHNRFYNEQKGYYCEYGKTEFLLNAQVLPYAAGITDEVHKETIKENVKVYAKAFDSGIFGVKHLFPALVEMGLEERLYEWITSKDVPSWGYWLLSGDNSLWEHWGESARSRNHHMFGTVDEWLYKTLAGVEMLDCRTLRIKPYISEKLEWASAQTQMSSGRVSCRWKKREEGVSMEIEIPVNVTATVYFPKKEDAFVYESGERIENRKEIQIIENKPTGMILKVGSGKYKIQQERGKEKTK